MCENFNQLAEKGSDTGSEVTELKVWKQSWLFQQKYSHEMI